MNQPSDAKSNPFKLENFVKIASICAAVIYGVLFIGYRTYFHELGITPEDIGVGSAFVLVRSIGFIALAIGAVALMASIVGVLSHMSSMRKADASSRGTSTRTLRRWLRDQRRYIPWLLRFAALAAGLMGYLAALKPWSWPLWWSIVVCLVLLGLAWVVEHVAGRQNPAVGLVIALAISILIAVVLPAVLIYFRAHDLADSALRGTVVKPYSILFGSIPVLDVSSDEVDVEWVCTGKKRPSVFDGRDSNTGELLAENPTSVFVRMDPEGKTPIVKLPADCVVTTRHEHTPALNG